jgi:inhibitor of KinA sporulation pathway (predicted exonuclease)
MPTRRRNPPDIANVTDIESTCWHGEPPPGQQSEIIPAPRTGGGAGALVGICELQVTSLEVVSQHSILIRPAVSTVSPFCTELTTITQEMLDEDGAPFAEACERLRAEHRSRERVWASYGDYDRRMFEQHSPGFQPGERRTGVPYPFGTRHLNVKTLAGLAVGLEHEVGMDAMLERLGLPLLGTHHRARDDAGNLARILGSVLAWARSRH